MNRPRGSKRRSYHHGDLRRALVEAGLAIVRARGVDALSLRAVARKARVSHSAPYHHFAGKAELLAAVAAAGFDRMRKAIAAQAAASRPPDPAELLRAVGRGYVRFALKNPSVFRLMFRPELTRPADHPLLQEAEARTFAVLLETVVAGQREGHFRAGDPRPLAAFAWSAVHGLATLHLDQVLGETPLGAVAVEALAEQVHVMVLAGLRAS